MSKSAGVASGLLLIRVLCFERREKDAISGCVTLAGHYFVQRIDRVEKAFYGVSIKRAQHDFLAEVTSLYQLPNSYEEWAAMRAVNSGQRGSFVGPVA